MENSTPETQSNTGTYVFIGALLLLAVAGVVFIPKIVAKLKGGAAVDPEAEMLETGASATVGEGKPVIGGGKAGLMGAESTETSSSSGFGASIKDRMALTPFTAEDWAKYGNNAVSMAAVNKRILGAFAPYGKVLVNDSKYQDFLTAIKQQLPCEAFPPNSTKARIGDAACNVGFIQGFMWGMDLNPSPNNVALFKNEIAEYLKSPYKKEFKTLTSSAQFPGIFLLKK
jgi:hypothetical protein